MSNNCEMHETSYIQVGESEVQPMSEEILESFCGDELGYGLSRKVFVYRPDPTLVLKIEYRRGAFQNVAEWKIWEEVKYFQEKYKHIPQWFAPCIWLSPCGKYLLQKRTEKPFHTDFPEKVLSALLDLKYDNFGVLVEDGKRRLVCHDYGVLSVANGINRRMKKAHWML